MNSVQDYVHNVTPFTKLAVSSILHEFRSFYKWKDNCDIEQRRALDIGCGDGSVTMEVIKPFLPKSTRLDAVDSSEEMIRHARNTYEIPGCKFFLLDVETEKLDEELVKSYDHVFSMFCFHFVRNPKQALRNIYNILKPNGNFTFVFIPKLPYFTVLKPLSLNPKWSPYMEDIDTVRPLPFVNMEFPHKVFAEMMSECGFKNIITKADVKYFLFDSMDTFEDQARCPEPFHKRMPLELQNEYFAEYFNALKKIDGYLVEKYNENGECTGVIQTVNVVVGYGEKGSQ